jgi:hypothetical protein
MKINKMKINRKLEAAFVVNEDGNHCELEYDSEIKTINLYLRQFDDEGRLTKSFSVTMDNDQFVEFLFNFIQFNLKVVKCGEQQEQTQTKAK